MTQPKTETNLTENELAILKASRTNDFADAGEGSTTWVFAVIQSSGLDPKVARGVIASLVKKGLVAIDDYEGDRKSDDMTFSLSPKGIEVVLEVIPID